MADTGNGATLTLSADGGATTYTIVSITPGDQSIEALEVSHLGTTGDKEYIKSDLKETPEGSAEVLFDVNTALPTPGSATQTITITFPKESTVVTAAAATLAGSGFVTSISYPELVSDTVMRATINWKMDGFTGPTFTAEV